MGVFETLLVLDGSPIELDAHLQRLSASLLELFAIELPAHARSLVIERAADLAVGRLRLTAAPERPQENTPTLEVVTAPVDPENVFPFWERATALVPFVIEGWVGGHKWADREGLVQMEAAVPDGALPLLLDVGDEVLEGSRANLFAVEGEQLVTPPLDGRILPGVARARAIESAHSLGIEVSEQPLAGKRLLAARRAFLTGSVRGIEPVSAVGDVAFEPPSEILAALTADMRRQWVGERPIGPLQTR